MNWTKIDVITDLLVSVAFVAYMVYMAFFHQKKLTIVVNAASGATHEDISNGVAAGILEALGHAGGGSINDEPVVDPKEKQ